MTLICGIPNAGKTTYSKKYNNVIHFDDVRGRDRRDKVIKAVSEDGTIVVEGVYKKAKERIALVEASKENNTCIWLDVPVDVCVERELNGRNRSEHMVIWASQDFESPTLDEGWDEIIIIRGNYEQCINRQTEN